MTAPPCLPVAPVMRSVFDMFDVVDMGIDDVNDDMTCLEIHISLYNVVVVFELQ